MKNQILIGALVLQQLISFPAYTAEIKCSGVLSKDNTQRLQGYRPIEIIEVPEPTKFDSDAFFLLKRITRGEVHTENFRDRIVSHPQYQIKHREVYNSDYAYAGKDQSGHLAHPSDMKISADFQRGMIWRTDYNLHMQFYQGSPEAMEVLNIGAPTRNSDRDLPDSYPGIFDSRKVWAWSKQITTNNVITPSKYFNYDKFSEGDISNSGKLVVVGSDRYDGNFNEVVALRQGMLWGVSRKLISKGQATTSFVKISNDEKKVLLLFSDRSLQMSYMRSENPTEIAKNISAANLSKSGDLVAAGQSNSVVLYKEKSPNEYDIIYSKQIAHKVVSLGFSPNDKIIVVGTTRGLVFLDSTSGNIIYEIPGHNIEKVTFASDGRSIIAINMRSNSQTIIYELIGL